MPTVKEDDYYAANAKVFMERRDEMKAILESGKVPAWANAAGKDPNPLYDGLSVKDIIINKGNDYEAALRELREHRANHKNCPNPTPAAVFIFNPVGIQKRHVSSS